MACNNNTMPLITEVGNNSCVAGCVPREINVICRKMIITPGQEIISIQGEDKSNSRTFIIPRITENGDDLTERGFIIITKDSEGNTHHLPVPVENIEHLDNYIKIKWVIDRQETAIPGDLYVEIEAGDDDFLWKTFPGKFIISDAIKVQDYEIEIEPSVVEQLELEIAKNSDEIELNKENINALDLKTEQNKTDINNLNLTKQDNLIAGDSIELNNNIISVVGLEKVKNAYSQIQKVKDYLYETYYDNLDYNYAKEYFKKENTETIGGACSSVRKGNLYGRNFDWTYDNSAEFVVKTSRKDGRYANIGIVSSAPTLDNNFVESGEYSEEYKILPFYLVDGINEKGVFCNVNVVSVGDIPMTRTIPTISEEDEISARMLPRYIVDNFADAESAINYLIEHVAIYAREKTQNEGYEYHYMIGDETKTYVLEIVNNQIVYTESNIMTNFYINGVTFNGDGKVYTPADVANGHLPSRDNGIEKFGAGLERYNLIIENYANIVDKDSMRELMNKLLYTRMYTSCSLQGGVANPFWFTEYVGNINGTEYTVDTLPSVFNASLVPYLDNLYVNRTRGAELKTWQSLHSSVYDIKERKLYVVFQEDNNELEFGFDYYYTAKEVDEKINDIDAELNDINRNVTQDISELDSRVTQNSNNISNLMQSIGINFNSVSLDMQKMAQDIRNANQDSQTNAQNIGVNSQAILEHDGKINVNANKIDAAEQRLDSNETNIIDLQDEVANLIETANGAASEHDSLAKRVTTLELTQNINASKNPVEVDESVFYYDNNVLKLLNSIDYCFQSVLYGGGESGYRKYKNGTLEQWGVATTNANGETEFTIHQAYKDMNYSIFIEPREIGNFFHYAYPSANQKFKCRTQTRDSSNIGIKIQWRSYGRWK